MYSDTVFHYDASAKEADACDNLRENTQVVIVDRSADSLCCHDDALADEDEDAGTNGNECIGSEACLMLTQLTLGTYYDTCDKRTGQTEYKNSKRHDNNL